MDTSIDTEVLKAAITRAMRDEGTNPKRLSKKIGKGETLIRDILKGRSQNPTLETVRAIATALGRPLEYFIGAQAFINQDAPHPLLPTVEDLTQIVQAILDTPKPPRELASSAAEELAKAVQYTLGRLAVRPEIRGNPAAIHEAFAAGFDLPAPHTHQ